MVEPLRYCDNTTKSCTVTLPRSKNLTVYYTGSATGCTTILSLLKVLQFRLRRDFAEMEKRLLLIMFCLFSVGAYAQQGGSIQGKVADAAGKPAEFATVLLLQSQDSALAKGAITDAGKV